MRAILFTIIMFILFLILLVPRSSLVEHFENTEFESDFMKNTCMDYIQKENLNINLDYNLKNMTPEDRQKQINLRSEIINSLDAVTKRKFSDINRQYEYAGKCVLRPSRNIIENMHMNEECKLQGKVLTDQLDPTDGIYGRYLVDPNVSVQFEKNEPHGSYDIQPNTGCYIDLDNKDVFFNKIDQLGNMKQFENKNNINLLDTSNNKMLQENKQLLDTMKLYGMSVPSQINKYGHSIITKCRDVSTNNINTDDWSYLSLNNVNIACGDSEVMNRFQLNKTGDNSFNVNYRCCTMQTEDNNIQLGTPVAKNTNFTPNPNNSMVLEKHDMDCLDPGIDPSVDASMLNYISMNNNPNTNQVNFKYNCSSIEKSMPDDSRKIHYKCKPGRMITVPKQLGIRSLTGLVAECPFGEGLSQLVVQDDHDNNTKYGLKYQCCRPKVDAIEKATPVKDRLISGSYLQTLISDKDFNQLTSKNGMYNLIMQSDGNLVLYQNKTKPLWASNTQRGKGVYKVQIALNGQLFIIDENNMVIWSTPVYTPSTQDMKVMQAAQPDKNAQNLTSSAAYGPFQLMCQSDGNVTIYGQLSILIWKAI